MKKEETISMIISFMFVLLDLIIMLFSNELFIKIIFAVISLIIVLFLFIKKIGRLKFRILISIFLLICNVVTILFGSFKDDTSNIPRGSYLLDISDAKEYIRNINKYSRIKDDEFIVKEAFLKNKDTNVKYKFISQSGKDILFENIPEGIYTYSISFKDIDKKFVSKNPEEITVLLMDSNSKKNDNSVYKYIKIDETKVQYSEWSDWSEYSSKKKEKNILTDVRVKLYNVEEDSSLQVKTKYYDTSKPIYEEKLVQTGSYINNGVIVPTYAVEKIFIGYEIIEKKTPIYSYRNAKLKYSYRTRTIINYSDAVKEYYARYDNNNILEDLGYIKIGVVPKNTNDK